MQEIGILSATDVNGETLLATMYDGSRGSLVRLYSESSGLTQDYSMAVGGADAVDTPSVIVRTSGSLQLISADEVMHLSMWLERAAMWMAMREEQDDREEDGL